MAKISIYTRCSKVPIYYVLLLVYFVLLSLVYFALQLYILFCNAAKLLFTDRDRAPHIYHILEKMTYDNM